VDNLQCGEEIALPRITFLYFCLEIVRLVHFRAVFKVRLFVPLGWLRRYSRRPRKQNIETQTHTRAHARCNVSEL